MVDETKYLALYKEFASLFTRVTKEVDESHEKLKILDHLTEAGMWLRMYKDMNASPEIRARVRTKPNEEVQKN